MPIPGDPIVPNSANLCINCLRNTYVRQYPSSLLPKSRNSSVDITEGIPKQGVLAMRPFSVSGLSDTGSIPVASVSYCRNCERFLAPPAQWTIARPESQELLAICLKKLKGLNRVRLTDAHFIWTEPHSKRLRISLTIQKEVCHPRLAGPCRSTYSNSRY